LYDAWGNIRYVTGTLPTDIGYTGQRLDNSTGLMYYRARYYAHYLNRWIQPDTIVPDPANPQSLNRYSYVKNRPLNFTDPTGHREDCGNEQCPTLTAEELQQIALRRLLATAGLYGITFIGEGWDLPRVGAVVNALANSGNKLLPAYQQAAAADLRNARRLAGSKISRLEGMTVEDFRQLADLNSANDVFKAVFGNLDFNHINENNPNAWAQTQIPVIRFYNGAFDNAQLDHFTWHFPAHELGHAFSQRAGRVPYTDLQVAGLGALATAGVWQQRREDTNNEFFADAFLGWVGNHLANNWNNWLDANMPRWIALAVTGN
jgi:RHS repeat-associated protein